MYKLQPCILIGCYNKTAHTLKYICREQCQSHIPKSIPIRKTKKNSDMSPELQHKNHSFETEQLFKSCHVKTVANLRNLIPKT